MFRDILANTHKSEGLFFLVHAMKVYVWVVQVQASVHIQGLAIVPRGNKADTTT
jgi:hypothetical protein